MSFIDLVKTLMQRMLTEAVVGGQTLVLTRYHKADVTRIRPHSGSQDRESVGESSATMPTLSIVQPC